MAEFGALLKQAREDRGMTLRQIATSTKISMAALEALEREDFLAAVSGHARSSAAADQVASGRLGFSPAS